MKPIDVAKLATISCKGLDLMEKLVVIGAGAAGVFGAINAKLNNPSISVEVLEGSRRPLNKVKISGGGRCNLTHHCFDPKKLVENYPRGRRELLGSFHRFQPQDTLKWFNSRGVDTKVEADGRMFPVTNNSQTIIDCLLGELDRLSIPLHKGAIVKSVSRNEGRFTIQYGKGEELTADKVLLTTGSAPIGFKVAASLGHTIVDPVPSLFTFNIEDPLLDGLAGQSFSQSSLKLSFAGSKKSFQQEGPLLITHWGLSGPGVLKLSAFAAKELFDSNYQASLRANFLAKKQGQILEEIQALQKSNPSKQMAKTAPEGLSKRFWARFLEVQGLSVDKPWQELGPKQAKSLAENLSSYGFQVSGKGQYKDEFVTCGGVKLGEVDFRTMESKTCPGLYLAGEILNIDGVTGGFNFQNAWTSSWIAAQAIAER